MLANQNHRERGAQKATRALADGINDYRAGRPLNDRYSAKSTTQASYEIGRIHAAHAMVSGRQFAPLVAGDFWPRDFLVAFREGTRRLGPSDATWPTRPADPDLPHTRILDRRGMPLPVATVVPEPPVRVVRTPAVAPVIAPVVAAAKPPVPVRNAVQLSLL